MFDFIFQKKGGVEEQSLTELITINAAKAAISDMAIEKAVGMIAKAIAKSEFIVQRDNKRVKDDVYWMLNVKTNPNESATDFWVETIRKILKNGECLVVHMNGYLYRATSFFEDDAVTRGKKYKNIILESNGNTCEVAKTFKADEVMHFRNKNEKVLKLLKKNLKIYNDIIGGLMTSKKISSIPKMSMNVQGQTPVIMIQNADGTQRRLSIDEYKSQVKKLLESEEIEIITNQMGLEIKQLELSTGVTTEDISKIAKEIYTECAYAFDIPRAVFLGEITEKADSTNEFITYSVNWLVEMINDQMNAALVGKEGYLNKGEKIWIDLSRYKHVDIIESAANLEKLRGIGFNFDEILELVGWEALETEFSKRRVVTKNFGEDVGGEKNAQENS